MFERQKVYHVLMYQSQWAHLHFHVQWTRKNLSEKGQCKCKTLPNICPIWVKIILQKKHNLVSRTGNQGFEEVVIHLSLVLLSVEVCVNWQLRIQDSGSLEREKYGHKEPARLVQYRYATTSAGIANILNLMQLNLLTHKV